MNFENLKQKIEDEGKSKHSKHAIITFFIFGTILFILNGEPINPFKGFFLFFMVGMFLISLLSVPSYLIKTKVLKNKKSYFLIELVYNVLMTYFLFRLFLLI